MQIFQASQFTEVKPHVFTAEASELRLPPGDYPESFSVEPSIGNGQPFARSASSNYQVKYRQQLGCVEIVIFND